jgi:hypothetical protein
MIIHRKTRELYNSGWVTWWIDNIGIICVVAMLRPQVGLFRWKTPGTWRSYREVTFRLNLGTCLRSYIKTSGSIPSFGACFAIQWPPDNWGGRLFGTPWRLSGPVAATWRTCDYYVINESLTQHKWTLATVTLSCSDCVCDSAVACVEIFSFKILDPRRNT